MPALGPLVLPVVWDVLLSVVVWLVGADTDGADAVTSAVEPFGFATIVPTLDVVGALLAVESEAAGADVSADTPV